ncbi:MAG: Recombination protein RecR [Candidatus Yanofskybacteria bacterium GW2011_GWA2_44_10]|nr:MAG: Recombination protein RecR [Candidatus Yanofskybacteria bacterium GW2011_GWA2_44_10]
MNPRFKYVVSLFRKLPGVGPRQAARFVLALMEKPDAELKELGGMIANLRNEIKFCANCFNLSENHVCRVCADNRREKMKILVVEKVTDLDSIEKTGLYRGQYHVLGGAINPVDGIMPDHLRIKELSSRVDEALSANSEIEVILATNPTTMGETTAIYLKDLLANKKGVNITRLGRGLASGSHLEYADEITLRNALESRR